MRRSAGRARSHGGSSKLPSGTQASEAGFETKAAALAWGRDQETRIREGRWTDPGAGKVTVGEWIGRWLGTQDVGISTAENRAYLIRRFIRPAWGDSPLSSLSTGEIAAWENGLPTRAGVSRRTARDARSLLCTILGDAAAAKPPLIAYNPALRPRNRGRRTGRRLDRAPQRAWATPLQALLLAERAALLSGRDDDFTMLVTIGYTGPCAGARRSVSNWTMSAQVNCTSSGSFARSAGGSTGSRPRTTPIAAPTGNRACPLISPASWLA